MHVRNKLGALAFLLNEDLAVRYLATRRYKEVFGRAPDLTADASCHSEKICRRKVFDRNPLFPILADKVLVKEHVRSLLGDDWVIPTLWHGKDIASVDLGAFERPFVIKANHGSNWNIFVRGDQDLDPGAIARKCDGWLSRKYGLKAGEWLYLHIDPQIMIEPFIGKLAQLPIDYKFLVFGGQARFVQVDTNRGGGHKRCFYDRDWIRQPFGLNIPLDERDIPRPKSLDRMVAAAERLAKDFDFARVDLYEIDDQPLFGEITFYPGSGLSKFRPIEWDRIIGGYWMAPR